MSSTKLICVYCGASPGRSSVFASAAAAFGEALVARGYGLVYGGTQVGLMGAVSEAVLNGGGEVVGVIPDFLVDVELARTDCTELAVVQTMHERKMRMIQLAEAVVVLPGGLGTLDEFFEALTWRDIGLHGKPIALLNTAGYWTELLDVLRRYVERGFVRAEALEGFRVFDEPEDVIAALESWPRDPSPPRWSDRSAG